jgi:hypothetical protein
LGALGKNGMGKKPNEDAIPIMYPLIPAMIAVPISIAKGVGGARSVIFQIRVRIVVSL